LHDGHATRSRHLHLHHTDYIQYTHSVFTPTVANLTAFAYSLAFLDIVFITLLQTNYQKMPGSKEVHCHQDYAPSYELSDGDVKVQASAHCCPRHPSFETSKTPLLLDWHHPTMASLLSLDERTCGRPRCWNESGAVLVSMIDVIQDIQVQDNQNYNYNIAIQL